MTAVMVGTAVVLGVVLAVRDLSRRPALSSPTRTAGGLETTCPPAAGTVIGKPQWEAPPEVRIDTGRRYTATLHTTKGRIVLELDARNAPVTVNNFVFLARCGFYDGLSFHRIVKNRLVEGGDPKGMGAGGPGYTFSGEVPDRPGYAVGSVAMSGDGRNAAGSRFFIVTGPGGSDLPNDSPLFARVIEGHDVAKAIEDLPVRGGAPDGSPVEVVTITSVTITEG